jgi:hypothetical protein
MTYVHQYVRTERERDKVAHLPDPEVQPTIDLWPTTGRAMGLSRGATYEAASRGQIPGLLRIGGRYRVATATLRTALGLEQVSPTGPKRGADSSAS